jgi:hypothetical protein
MERRERRQADVHKRLGKVAYGVVLTGFPWTQFAAGGALASSAVNFLRVDLPFGAA